MTMMKKTLLASLACLAVAGTAVAGRKHSAPIGVWEYGASGNLGDARASANTVEQIGCNVFGWDGEQVGYVFCWGVDAKGNSKMCYSQGVGSIVEAASSVGPASYIAFTIGDEGECDSLDVQNHSLYTPMVP